MFEFSKNGPFAEPTKGVSGFRSTEYVEPTFRQLLLAI